MVRLLTIALINNGEKIEDIGLLVSKILYYLSHKDIVFFVFYRYLLRIIHPN